MLILQLKKSEVKERRMPSPKMYKKRQYIILSFYIDHIILKFTCRNLASVSGRHEYNISYFAY